MSRKPGSRGCDQVPSEYLEARSEARGVRNGSQGMIHCGGRSPDEREGAEAGGGGGGVERWWGWESGVEMRVAAPFFTADKNICWDINLELQSSLPLLPCHPSSFRANHHLGTPPHLRTALHPRTCTLKQPYPSIYPQPTFQHTLCKRVWLHETHMHQCMRMHCNVHKSVTLQMLCVKRKCKVALKRSTSL